METIFSSFNFTRVMFCFINKSRTSINARFGFGKDVEPLVNRLSIPVGGDTDIFNLALKHQKDMVIEDMSERDNRNMMPDWYRRAYSKKSMLVFPLVVKNIPVGILYIDSILPVSVSDEAQLAMIKTLRNKIILAIRHS